jgi:hypothetical protein
VPLPVAPWRLLQVADSFPFEWIKKKWKEGFYVTSMATCVNQWAVVMSKTTGIVDQVRMDQSSSPPPPTHILPGHCMRLCPWPKSIVRRIGLGRRSVLELASHCACPAHGLARATS